jgi:SAM-dependent methyltransferase
MIRSKCLICSSENISKVIDLGMHSFADSFIKEEQLGQSEPIYPLECALCNDCGQVQTTCETNPNERYNLYTYSYTSSNSAFSRNHWEYYANEVLHKTGIGSDSFVVEIGSNDGYLINQFKKKGHKILGVDPSEYIAKLANDQGIETVVHLFNAEVGRQILKAHGRPKLMIANNVFNHSDNPVEFINAVGNLLDPDGYFVYELPYWFDTIKSGKIDQVYHEHVGYFTIKSSQRLLQEADMVITDIDFVDYHGGSIRVFARKASSVVKECEKARQVIQDEINYGLFQTETYHDLMKSMLQKRFDFLKTIYEIKSRGGSIIAIGAAAKGNTNLSFYNLDNTVIDYVTDSSPHKKGKYTPLTRIPICGDEVFTKYEEVYALFLAWNIADIVKPILLKINSRIKFLEIPK